MSADYATQQRSCCNVYAGGRVAQLRALRITAGDAAETILMSTLQRAREEHFLRACGSGSGNLPGSSQPQQPQNQQPMQEDPPEDWQQLESSILHESGRGEIVVDAAADGSSFVCPRCWGVVSMARQEAHNNLWCPALGNN
eukprot:jgi/Mesvir1/29691/Mv00926-RA.1